MKRPVQAQVRTVSGPPTTTPLLPECLLEECSPEPIAAAALALLEQPAVAAAQADAARREVRRLGVWRPAGELLPPSTLAARALLRAIDDARGGRGSKEGTRDTHR